MRALNPVLRIDTQVGEPYVIHRGDDWATARVRVVDLLGSVHIPSRPPSGRSSIPTSSRAACNSAP